MQYTLIHLFVPFFFFLLLFHYSRIPTLQSDLSATASWIWDFIYYYTVEFADAWARSMSCCVALWQYKLLMKFLFSRSAAQSSLTNISCSPISSNRFAQLACIQRSFKIDIKFILWQITEEICPYLREMIFREIKIIHEE